MRAMQRIQPQLAEIREKYKKDPQRQQREMMKLYKDAGVNPMGGCLPLLIQSPVFMALYNVLQHAIELRQAPFMMWIDDLSAQDALFMIPFSLPFLGHAFNLLPILMGVGQYYQQKTSMPTGAAADPRTQMMGYIMPPMLTIMFYRLPSGLVLYWIVNTLLSILHQHYMNRGESTAGGTPPPPPGKRRRGRRGAVTGNGGGVASEPAVTAGKSSSEE
jgi:YidC/Oxa1 family membrane protein insertase